MDENATILGRKFYYAWRFIYRIRKCRYLDICQIYLPSPELNLDRSDPEGRNLDQIRSRKNI